MSTLQLEEDETFQRRERRVQRIGWALVSLAFVAAVVGGWGYGPISQAVETRGQQRLEYTRIVHRQTEDDLQIRGSGPTVRLTGDWVDAVDIERVIPEPESMRADQSGLTLEFGQAQVQVELGYQARHLGPLRGQVEVGGQQLPLNQVVLP